RRAPACGAGDHASLGRRCGWTSAGGGHRRRPCGPAADRRQADCGGRRTLRPPRETRGLRVGIAGSARRHQVNHMPPTRVLTRGVLLVLLGLTGLLQVVEGIASIVDPAGMMAGLKLAMAPGVEVPVTFLGLAMIVRGAVTGIALRWILQGKAEGLFLARFTAATIL